MRREVGKVVVLHKPLDASCHGIGVTGKKNVVFVWEEKRVFQNRVWVLGLHPLSVLLEQCNSARHERDSADAVCGLGGADNNAALWRIGNAAFNSHCALALVDISPLQPHTLAPPNACRYQ